MMKTVKGVVTKLGDGWAVLLTTDGTFVRAPTGTRRLVVGSEVEVTIPSRRDMITGVLVGFLSTLVSPCRRSPTGRGSRTRAAARRGGLASRLATSRLAWVAAAAFLFVLGGTVLRGMAPPAAPAILVALDINPSLELGLDQQLKLVRAQGLNKEGTHLARTLRRGMTLAEAVTASVAVATAWGYIDRNRDDNVVLASVLAAPETGRARPPVPGTAPDGTAAAIVEDAIATIDEATREAFVSTGVRGYLKVWKMDPWERAEGKRLNMSANRYHLLKLAREQGAAVNSAVLRKSVRDAMFTLGAPPEELFEQFPPGRTTPPKEPKVKEDKEQKKDDVGPPPAPKEVKPKKDATPPAPKEVPRKKQPPKPDASPGSKTRPTKPETPGKSDAPRPP